MQLECHVAHGCNLFCTGCTHFSQESYSGRHTVQSFREEVAPWSKRLLPQHFLILGGEPMLNPDLAAICAEARRLWPEVNLILVTIHFAGRMKLIPRSITRPTKCSVLSSELTKFFNLT